MVEFNNARNKDLNFLKELINLYYLSLKSSNNIVQNKISLAEFSFIQISFVGLRFDDLKIFDFTNCDISGSQLDRASIDYFKQYIQANNIIYKNISVDGANLGPKFVKKNNLGLQYNQIFNVENMNISGISFRNCNLHKASFKGANITGCNFSNCKNILPEQFTYCQNIAQAIFFDNLEMDEKFKEKIQKLSQKSRKEPAPYISGTNNSLAMMLDTPDTIRLDDPGYIYMRNKMQKQNG